MSDDSHDWVEVGCVMRPHGIRGELRVKMHNPNSEVLFDSSKVVVRGGDPSERVMTIERARAAADGIVLMVVEGIKDRNAAEGLRSCTLHVRREELPATDDGEFYVHDILGAKVVGEDGKTFGEVVDYVTYPTTDVIVVQGEKRYEVPVIDDFVLRIDAAAKSITVASIDDFETT